MKEIAQTDRILKYLASGKGLTSLQALKMFGCMRLASRIYDIRQDEFKVESYMVKRNGKRFCKYFLR